MEMYTEKKKKKKPSVRSKKMRDRSAQKDIYQAH